MLTPLPPAQTGVAYYSSILLPALAERVSVQAFTSLDGYRRADFDNVIYQLGNNPHHAFAYAEAMREPGVIVLHDLVMHHLIVEMTLARGDVEGYVAALEANHGPAGAAWARGRAAGLHTEMGNFLLPASVEIARRSKAVIVHNHYAAERLRSFGVATPIHVLPHPYVPETRTFDGDAIRARLGLTGKRVIGVFGFLTAAKRGDVVLEAFRRANDPNLALLIVGQPAPNVEVPRGEGIVTTGYVSDEDFPAYYAAIDRLVNLRYPSAGEASGTLIRAFEAGKPVAVSDYAQFAEFPDEVAFKVPLGGGEVDALVEFMTREFADTAPAQKAWLEEHASFAETVAGYATALECGGPSRRSDSEVRAAASAAAVQSVPLFPRVVQTGPKTIRNDGDSIIRTHTYGQPEFRLVARFRNAEDRWLALPCDLHPGQSVTLDLDEEPLQLFHALQSVPVLELEEVPRVR